MNHTVNERLEPASFPRGIAALATVGLCLIAGSRAGAQLSLRDAFREADHGAYGNRVAAGNTSSQRAQALGALKGVVPSVHFEAGYVETTDPIGVFGSTLRQRAITQENFDPQRLNYPSATSNYQGGIVLEQPLVNADAWSGRRAAVHAADAARDSEEWKKLSTRVDVVRAYFGAVLATERVTTLQAAARAAHAHAAQAEAMVKQGLVTKSDALLASVRAGEMDGQLAEATGGVVTARRQLAVVLGRDGAVPADLGTRPELPSSDRIRAEVAADTAAYPQQTRLDVRAATDGEAAARDDKVRARSALLPRLNGFARYDWNSPTRLYSGDRNWTVGVMASWSPFAGPSELAEIQGADSRAATAHAQADATRANANLDDEQTRTALSVALTRLGIAERAAAQSAEAHRIVSRKYEGGLASVVELLDAQAVETQSALALSEARWGTIAAGAARRLALGIDPATLAALDESNSVAGGRDNATK
jgi:outer membrane protein TolC